MDFLWSLHLPIKNHIWNTIYASCRRRITVLCNLCAIFQLKNQRTRPGRLYLMRRNFGFHFFFLFQVFSSQSVCDADLFCVCETFSDSSYYCYTRWQAGELLIAINLSDILRNKLKLEIDSGRQRHWTIAKYMKYNAFVYSSRYNWIIWACVCLDI